MALNKTQLKTDIKSLLTNMSALENQEQSMEALSDGLATIIDAYIKTAKATVPSGSIVTAGSATTQTGPTAPILLSIS